ncbi:MAG: GNAT family N-acetyltransferase [Anaerolineae bacterium]|nr:GNAT family N-acetyltransferase [Anaerolineae bacterium]
MSIIILRPAEPEHDFEQLAAWFSLLEDEPSSTSGLQTYYAEQKTRITQQVAQNDRGELLGFYWATRDQGKPHRVSFFLFVEPAHRRHGLGGRLFAAMETFSKEIPVTRLRTNILETCPEGRRFAERHGFTLRLHVIGMTLDLRTFNEKVYDNLVAILGSEGFQFTSMEALGNGEEAQRNLYELNRATSLDIPGTDGEEDWGGFEDFQRSVCQAPWYKPAGQMVVIEQATGKWVAMSAITQLEGAAYAYNLHTGVARAYRGRKLGQAVKVQALRFARDTLGVTEVRTHHVAQNHPMIAIDQKFGYQLAPGYFVMEKLYS